MAAPSGSLWWRDNGFGVSFLIKAQKKIHLWSQFYFAILLPWTECVTETDLVGIWEQEKTVSVGVWCTTEAPGHEFVSLCDVVLILRWVESWESKLLNYVWWKHTLTLRHEPFCVVVLLFGELVGRPAGTKLQQVLKWKQIEAVWCMYISSSTGRKSKLCWERLIFFMLTLPICGTWTPHGARLWHCWYLIDVREKKRAQTKHNYIYNDYGFFSAGRSKTLTGKPRGKPELSQKPWKLDVSWVTRGFTLGSVPDRSSHALVSLLLKFMICIELIRVSRVCSWPEYSWSWTCRRP